MQKQYFKNKQILFLPFLLLFTCLNIMSVAHKFSLQASNIQKIGSSVTPTSNPQRIISLAPSITEVLFHLNLGDRVIGVTNYCNYPKEASKRKKIGGFIDPNIELIISLNPDLVIALPDHQDIIKKLKELNINYLAVPQYNIQDIINSILVIGKVCGKEKEAREAKNKLSEQLDYYKNLTKNLQHPSVIVSIGREISNGILEQTYLVSPKSFLSEIVHIAGGRNSVTDTKMTYPIFTREGILSLDPDVIIDVVPEINTQNYSKEEILKAWKSLGEIKAVKNNKIFLLESDYAAIPGPRIIQTIREFIKIIHPELQLE